MKGALQTSSCKRVTQNTKEICSAHRAMAKDRSRSPDNRKTLWLHVKGAERAVKIVMGLSCDVDELISALKSKVTPLLDKVPVCDMQLFTSREGEEVSADCKVSDIRDGHSSSFPLFVHYKEPQPQASQATHPFSTLTFCSKFSVSPRCLFPLLSLFSPLK